MSGKIILKQMSEGELKAERQDQCSTKISSNSLLRAVLEYNRVVKKTSRKTKNEEGEYSEIKITVKY